MSEPKINLVLNDTHCGSEFGLLPEHVTLPDGRSLGCHNNEKLRFLWESWVNMQERFHRMRAGEPYILTLNGDLIEGVHHRSTEVVAAKSMEHLTIAKEALLGLMQGASTVYVTKGTECHTEEWEDLFCAWFELSAAKNVQQYTVNGCLCDARHHMPTASTVTSEANGLSKVLANSIANMVRVGHPIPSVFMRAHRHVMGDYCDGRSLIVVPGPWQFKTRFAHKVAGESVTRFSSYALDWRNSPEGELPATHRFVYDPPYEILHS